MVTTKQQQQLDLADRIEKVQALIDEISREIDTIKANSPIAPPACGIVRFRAKGKGGAYWYYKWQSPKPIFVTKRGNSSRYKYIGKAGSTRRQKFLPTLKEALSSLFELSAIKPTTRFELPVERLGQSPIEIINKVGNFLLKRLNRGEIAAFK